jgi:hypothetical protein
MSLSVASSVAGGGTTRDKRGRATTRDKMGGGAFFTGHATTRDKRGELIHGLFIQRLQPF